MGMGVVWGPANPARQEGGSGRVVDWRRVVVGFAALLLDPYKCTFLYLDAWTVQQRIVREPITHLWLGLPVARIRLGSRPTGVPMSGRKWNHATTPLAKS